MKSVSLTLLAIGSLFVSASGQWSSVSNPPGFDDIRVFLPDGEGLLAGTGTGKVYTSADHGVTWSELAAGLPDEVYAPVETMTRAGEWVVMSRSLFDVYNFRSHFDGESWSEWTPIAYQDAPSEILLSVYDPAGRLVSVLAEGRRDAGRYDATWNGRDDVGRDAASGVYFARLVSGDDTTTRKMVLVR